MGKVLVAGVGNVLRRDDGFGVVVAKRLEEEGGLPADVAIIEVGTGGVHLVQELLGRYEALVVVDLVDRGSPPGTVHVLQVEVPDIESMPLDQRMDFLADMHYTSPARALMLAKALKVLPGEVRVVGCQPAETNELGVGLSEPVAAAVDRAMAEVRGVVQILSKAQSS